MSNIDYMPSKEEFDKILAEDPLFAERTNKLSTELRNKPGFLEGVIYAADDAATLADPRLQESIWQLEAGELVDITPKN